MLGSLVKNKFAMSAKSLLTYLAEIRLCRSWFKRCFDEAHDDPASDAAASAPAGNAPQAPSSQTEGSEYEPRPDTAFRTARIADDDGRQACRRTAEALKPFTTKKAFRLNPARTDAVCVDIDTAFQWAYEALYLKTQRSYVRRPSISAEIDRMGRFDTETTRASFVKACQSAIGALGNASENGSEVHEGTLQTVLDRLEIIREWLALDAAEQS